ncbi:MAG: S8/S53 family peptidase [Acidothermales bacterium]|nr:S8/S53 family peptidase [Acidothermales bacterium]
MRRLRRKRLVTAAVAASGVALLVVGSAASSADAAAKPRLMRGTATGWAHKAHDLGKESTGRNIDFGVVVGMRDKAGADQKLRDLSTPGSASYGKWLSTAQFKQRYAPSAADVSSVRHWLSSNGFRVDKTFGSGMYVKASGTVAQADKVFGVSLHDYEYKGRTLSGTTQDISLPAGAPAVIQGVTGLDGTQYLKTKGAAKLPGPPPGARYGVQPCSGYDGQKTATDKPEAYGTHEPYVICGYTPHQYQSAYGVQNLIDSGVDGRGTTVAITDAYAAPTIFEDTQKYSDVYGLPRFGENQFSQVLPNHFDRAKYCGAQGWYGEETLDVQAVHTMAPGAKVSYVAGADCGSGLDDAWAQTIENHAADVITNSWGYGGESLSASLIQFYDQYAMMAALTGITDNFSTGDAGDEVAASGSKQVDMPASDPYVSGIGGTSVGIDSSGAYGWEHGWQNAYSQLSDDGKSWTPAPPGDYSSGGGGGTSQLWPQPFYQAGKVPTSMSEYFGSTPMRTIPDISMPGDPNTGFVVGETQQFPDGTYWDTYRIGGTSLSSPLMAGVVALANQYSGHPLGFTNPLYYQMLGNSAVHDVTHPASPIGRVRTDYTNFVDSSGGFTYQLQTVDVQSTTIHSLPGYDDETGVGSPNGLAFMQFAKQASTSG